MGKKLNWIISTMVTVIVVASLFMVACTKAPAPTTTPAPTTPKPTTPAVTTPAPTTPKPTTPATTTPAPTTPKPTTPATTTPPVSGPIVPKGSAVIAIAQMGKQPADPAFFIGSPEWPVMFGANQRLLYLDPDGKILPGLAQSWEVDADGVTWTFHLVKTAKFHSGNPITANDFVFSFNRVAVDGIGEPALVSAMRVLYEKMWATDDYTLKLKTKVPMATLPAELCHQGSNAVPCVIDMKYFQRMGDDFVKASSLSGPYKISENKIGEYTMLEAFNDAYPQAPYTKTIKLAIVPEVSTRLAMVKTGQADIAGDITGPAIPEAKATAGITTASAKDVDILEMILSDFYYPEEKKPVMDVRVRQALAYAIDRKAIADKLYFGEAIPQLIPSAVGWMFGADATIPGYGYDVAKAKQLLKDAGYPNGFDLTITARAVHMDLATAVAGFWKDAGINVKLEAIEPAIYLRDAPQKKLRGVFVTTVPTAPPDIGIRYAEYYLKEGLAWGWCKDPTFNKLTAEMLATMDPAKREPLAKALTRKVFEELPSRIPVIARAAVYAIGPKVLEFVPGKNSYFCYPQLLKMK